LLTDIAEHVFEGQLIGDFFSDWLNNGAIFNQLPKPRKPKAKWSCDKAKDYVFADPDGHWTYYQSKKMPNAPTTFFKLILAELGSKGHLDRLTIFKSRANGMKGAVSSSSHYRWKYF
jgi:chitinase